MATNKWQSKLGNEFNKDEIERMEMKSKSELDRLRRTEANRRCADCNSEPTVWASVNLGVFLCIRCGSHHRGIGTHVTKPKGCTGTYLWGPDELEQMASIGNEKARYVYGGDEFRPQAGASDATWKRYICDKYEHRKFASSVTCASQHQVTGMTEKAIDKNETLLPGRNYLELGSNEQMQQTPTEPVACPSVPAFHNGNDFISKKLSKPKSFVPFEHPKGSTTTPGFLAFQPERQWPETNTVTWQPVTSMKGEKEFEGHQQNSVLASDARRQTFATQFSGSAGTSSPSVKTRADFDFFQEFGL